MIEETRELILEDPMNAQEIIMEELGLEIDYIINII